MKFVIAAPALMLLMAGPAGAQIISCDRFDRSSTDAPQFVRDWLKGDAKELFVSVCGVGDYRTYLGATDLVHDRNVCRYSTYVLNLSGTSPSRLERTATPPLTHTLVSHSSTCPSPSPGPDTLKYLKVSRGTFLSVWPASGTTQSLLLCRLTGQSPGQPSVRTSGVVKRAVDCVT